MVNSGEIFQPSSAGLLEEASRQAYNKIKPINVGLKEVVPSVRIGTNVTSAGKYLNVLKPSSKNNVPIAIYQVSVKFHDLALVAIYNIFIFIINSCVINYIKIKPINAFLLNCTHCVNYKIFTMNFV